MQHFGDITKISGYEVPIVDCIIGGSPCQDLSVAGKRAGLEGERSGLFMEQIRIVKEMRERDARCGVPREFIRPRYMVWENVPGAFSSNKGEDFRIVLEEIVKIVEPEANVPMPEKNKWAYSGILLGDGWSVAWRVLDAQFWGTSDKPLPQRRRRIALVADFGGQSAPEILFVRKSVSGNSQPGEEKRKEASGNVRDGAGTADCERGITFDARGNGDGYVSATITGDHQSRITDYTAIVCEPVGAVGFPLGFRPENVRLYDEMATTLCNGTRPGFTTGVIQFDALCIGNGQLHQVSMSDKDGALNCMHDQQAIMQDGGNGRYIVRRLTPLECERLQGYPDGWTDIGDWIDSNGKKRKAADSPRYKALGNSIALPPWKWVLKRLCACYERDATMASLFDGIGGFPLIWEQLNGKGSCLWASENDEFPMAVTKLRFGLSNQRGCSDAKNNFSNRSRVGSISRDKEGTV